MACDYVDQYMKWPKFSYRGKRRKRRIGHGITNKYRIKCKEAFFAYFVGKALNTPAAKEKLSSLIMAPLQNTTTYLGMCR